MIKNLQEKISTRVVSKNVSILDALKKMDGEQVKLLIVENNDKFLGLLSLGDIQRAILDKIPLTSTVLGIMRKNCHVANISMSEDEIKKVMIENRIEFMPVVENERVVNAYFWDEIFQSKQNENKLDIPVVIMAGGQGSRLKPLTNIIPKPLVPIGEKPVIEIIMDSFFNIGAENFFLSVNYKAEMIERYFDDIQPEYSIEYFKENKPLGTAGSMYLLKNSLDKTFFVTNCDILINQNYYDIYKYHKDNHNEITIVASLKHYKIPYGTIETGKNGELLSMEEKPELTFMINTGMYILEPSVLSEINDDEFLHITDLIEKLKNSNRKIGVFPISEKSWMDMGQWDEYHQTLKDYELKFSK